MFAGRGLGAENIGARYEFGGRIVLDLVVQVQDMQDIQHLALVFMQTLDLYVENGAEVDLDAVVLFNICGQPLLIMPFDLREAVEHLFVLAKGA